MPNGWRPAGGRPRLKVEVDLLKMALEDERSAHAALRRKAPPAFDRTGEHAFYMGKIAFDVLQ